MASLRIAPALLRARWSRAALAAGAAILLSLSPFGAWIERQLGDVRERLWWSVPDLAPVTVLAIDEPTLDALGAWPWPREQWQRVLKGIHDRYTPMVIGLDLVFPPGPSADADLKLAQALARYPVVLGQMALPQGSVKGLWRGQFRATGAELRLPDGLRQPVGVLANAPVIARSAGAGHINALLDADGVLRRYVPAVCWREQCSVSLGLATVARAFGAEGWGLARESAGARGRLSVVGLEHLSMPIPARGAVSMPWQRYHAIPVVSLAEVAAGTVDPRLINDRLLLVGSTAPGLADNVVTPVLNQMPGVMAHALMASAVIEDRLPRQPPWTWAVVLSLYLAAAAALLWREWRLWQVASIGMGGLLAAGLVAVPAYHLVAVQIPAAWLVLSLALLTLGQGAWHLSQGGSELIRRLTPYLPATLVRVLRGNAAVAPRLAWSTLLYADTVGYTDAAQRLSPEALAGWVNTGLDIVIRLVERHGGTIDNIAGDGLMAYWDQGNAEDQANQALQAAMTACRALRAASHELESQGLPALDMGFGLHAGLLLAGSFGAGQRKRYTIHGEAANLAQRIEKATRKSSFRLLMSQTLATIQTKYHAVSTDLPLSVGTTLVALYTVTRKSSRRVR